LGLFTVDDSPSRCDDILSRVSAVRQSKTRSAILSAGRVRVEGNARVNRQGQAHIVSTASRLRTWFSIDPQPASISPTINISIVFICAFRVDCGRIIRYPAIKNDSRAILSAAHAI